MPEAREDIERITFENGLIDGVEPSVLPRGALHRCRNWIPEDGGNLRARRAWNKTSRDGLASGAVRGRGIGHLVRQITSYLVPSLARAYNQGSISGTSQTITFTGNPTAAGSALVITIFLMTNTTGLTVPGGYTLAHASPDGLVRIYVAPNAPAVESVSVSWTTSQANYLIFEEWRNVEAVLPVDKIANASGTSTTPVSGTTAATTTDYDVAIAAIRDPDNLNLLTPTNGFTKRLSTQLAGNPGMAVYDKVLSAAGTASTGVTTPTSDSWQGVIVTLKAASIGIAGTQGFYAVAHADVAGSEYELYTIDREGLATDAWTIRDTVAVVATGDPVAFAAGLSKLFYTNVRFTTARQWDPSAGASSVAGSPPGRCITFHKDRLFIGGSIANPTRLDWSDVGSSSFSGGSAGNSQIGRDDGEPIEDIIPFEDSLLIGKQTSLWMLTGAGPDNFRRIRLPAGGAAPGRSMVATPYGAFVAGRKHVWHVAGGSVRLVSQKIAGSYGMTGAWMEARFVDDDLYILDQGSGKTWVLDVPNGRWHDEVIDDVDEQPALLFAQDDRLLYAPAAALDTGLLGWRLEPGSARAKDFNPLSETFQAHFQVWPTGPDRRFTPRFLYGKWRQRGGSAPQTGITITPFYDGVQGKARTLAPRDGADVFRQRIAIGDAVKGKGIAVLELRLEQTVPSGQTSLIEPEELALGYITERLG